jgi:hypothetical protein
MAERGLAACSTSCLESAKGDFMMAAAVRAALYLRVVENWI